MGRLVINKFKCNDMKSFKRTKNTVKKEIIAEIPETVQERRIFLNKQLLKYIDTTIHCPALGVTVEFTRASHNETIRNAAISKSSTIAALNVLRLIKNASYVGMDMPQSNKQKKTFQFIFVYILKSYLIGYGNVKILVGVQERGKFLHYSVTIAQ